MTKTSPTQPNLYTSLSGQPTGICTHELYCTYVFFLCWIWKSRARFGCCLSIRLVLHQKFCLVLNVSQTGFFMNHILTWGVLFQKNCGSQIAGFKMMKCTWFFTILTARLCIFYLSNIVQQYWTENFMRIFSYVT
jgi:hypothetical protein